MSAVGTGAIGPVSVRYAAQIRQLLFAQAIQRIAADQEAARAQSNADRAAHVEPARKSDSTTSIFEDGGMNHTSVCRWCRW